jgi:cyclopropane fatty-acyl-phospholipid synthase-like methyltransferase
MQDKKIEDMASFFDERVDSYDIVHVGHIDGGIESKNIVAKFIPDNTNTILDLGCGTGLELEKVFERFPSVKVIGIDVSIKMLGKLKDRYQGFDIELICQDYFDYDFGKEKFDSVISVMSLHHFAHEEKEILYTKIYNSLKKNGVFVNSDYIIDSQEEENFHFDELARKRKEQELGDGIYHFDTPLTKENEINILKRAGFINVTTEWEVKNNKVLVAKK